MFKKKFFFLFMFLSMTIAGFGQALDTALVLKNIKVNLFAELGSSLVSENVLQDYLNRKLEARVLKSKGFDDIIFFKISDQFLSVDTITVHGRKMILKRKLPSCAKEECYFVYAFNKINERIYPLKGTKKNDFNELYESIQHEWQFWKIPSKINKATINKFTENYWVEGLDFACLLRSLKVEQSDCLDWFSPPVIVY